MAKKESRYVLVPESTYLKVVEALDALGEDISFVENIQVVVRKRE